MSTSRKVATRPERTSGSAMVKKTRNFEAPSISALSSRSSGMPAKKSRVSHTTIGRLTAV